MSDNRNRTSSAGVWIIAFVILSPALYVMSVGPAVWLDYRDRMPEPVRETVRTAYRPLDYIYANSESARPWLDWYVSLWK